MSNTPSTISLTNKDTPTPTRVLVVGSGCAGIAAAVSAAEAGAYVTLVDSEPRPGGVVTRSLVHTICGLYEPPDHTRFANDGFPRILAELLVNCGCASAAVRMNRVSILPIDPLAFPDVVLDIFSRYENLRYLPKTRVEKVHRDDDHVTSVSLQNSCSDLHIDALVDATGNAVIASLLSHPTVVSTPSAQQHAGYIFSLTGLPDEVTTSPDERLRLTATIHFAARRDQLPSHFTALHCHPAPNADCLFFTIDLEEALQPPSDSIKKSIPALIAYLRENGYPGAHVGTLSNHPGVRESNRWATRNILTGEMLLSAAQHSDQIATAAWPIENRTTTAGPKFNYLDGKGALPGIPLSTLIARYLTNVFAAGRCIGADADAHASIRVLGTAMATGQAAGFAAATMPSIGDAEIQETAAAFHNWLKTEPFARLLAHGD